MTHHTVYVYSLWYCLCSVYTWIPTTHNNMFMEILVSILGNIHLHVYYTVCLTFHVHLHRYPHTGFLVCLYMYMYMYMIEILTYCTIHCFYLSNTIDNIIWSLTVVCWQTLPSSVCLRMHRISMLFWDYVIML